MASSAYADVRAAIASSDGAGGGDGDGAVRVEVNQRALIDKILARYASAGAVYRELLQNSNDAEATTAEIVISTTSSSSPPPSSEGGGDARPSSSSASAAAASSGHRGGGRKDLVTQVIYRNDGHPFRPQDWNRLRKIAEGNPDESKVGAFGVGAYTMFSVCEEPVVVSGRRGEEEAMAFFWRGDALWTKTGKAPKGIVNMSASLTGKGDDPKNWTSFILPSRDPYPVPDLIEFGQFLTASLTFTQCLKTVRVYVDSTLRLDITKRTLESHTIETPKASSWWKNDGAVTSSSTGMFSLGKGSDLTQTSVRMTVSLRGSPKGGMETSTVRARYASAAVQTSIPAGIVKRMVRVTKKRPPKELTVQIFLDAAEDEQGDTNGNARGDAGRIWKDKKSKPSKKSGAALITDSFAPAPGEGRVFIGFRTSQTTGMGIHLAAPLMPTVEREAIDFVDAALREYNSELLEIGGVLMRLALEHEMGRIGVLWESGKEERKRWEENRKKEESERRKNRESEDDDTSIQGMMKDAPSVKEEPSIQSSLFSFAKFMARGVKDTMSEAIKAVPEILVGEDDETTELLNPSDGRPLSMEERDAIVLMRAYCPRQSTPDSLVGQCLAKGFVCCLPKSSPPVLTSVGVARGADAKLPNRGMEAFGFNNVVRRIMLENAREYYEMTAEVPKLNVDDLVHSLRNQVIEEKLLIRLLKWWPKACRVEQSLERHGLRLKEVVRFHSSAVGVTSEEKDGVEYVDVRTLESILYFCPTNKLSDLPLPETCLAASIQKEIGQRTLENKVYRGWFLPLPFDFWAAFISHHPCMAEGRPQDENISVLAALSQHFDSLDESSGARRRFMELLPLDSPCIPYDGDDAAGDSTGDDGGPLTSCTAHGTAVPRDLYLSTSDLSAFAGVGVFSKASRRLKSAGVSDAFLLAMGVRTTISIDFLFLHLDTLCWNTNPKPLIKYLLDANLSSADLLKLRSTQYLPAEDDKDNVYAPSELYLKNETLSLFPFVRFLQWPASEGMSKSQRDFLIDLGVRVDPPLNSVMSFMEKESKKNADARDEGVYIKALQYLTGNLGPRGKYEKEFSRYSNVKILPCIRQNLETLDVVKEMQSPSTCYYNPSALVMGFPTLDPQLDTVHIAARTKCNKDPPPSLLIKRLIQLVNISVSKVEYLEKKGGGGDEWEKLSQQLLSLFDALFAYLATRASDFAKNDLATLAKKPFIPCASRGRVVFYLPSQIFFKKESSSAGSTAGDDCDSLAETLFQQIKYNAFLSLAGVKAEPSLQEIFTLMIERPDEVLDILGEAKYKMLLRRIASDPPFAKITKKIRECPFLLGYLVIDEQVETGDTADHDEGKSDGQKAQYVLARADDIYIVDNSFLRRQFPMLVCPLDQSLEDFYNKVGSRYVSEVVKKEFDVQGGTHHDTPLTRSFARRIRERKPLLLSPTNSSRPLSANANKVLDDQYLDIIQADSIRAKYSFERSSKHLKVTCCFKQRTREKTNIYLTTNPDWFDIGSAIGALILQRCQLEDALLLSQLLESPLETLRYRGFPVDRVLRPVSKPPPPPPPQPTLLPQGESKPVHNPEADSVSTKSKPNETDGPGNKVDSGFDTIIKQMFPSISPDVIQGLLGPNPTKEKARQVADMLAAECPPGGEEKVHDGKINEKTNADDNRVPTQPTIKENSNQIKERKKKPSSFMSKMLKGFPGVSNGSEGKKIINNHTQSLSQNVDRNKISSPEIDSSNQKSLETMLNQAVQSSRSIENAGIRSPETLLNHLPQGLERGSEGCEVISAKDIRPFMGPHGNGKTRNGIKVFACADTAPEFLSANFNAAERFSIVVHHLATVFELHTRTVAIYYDPKGGTIAFNSNRALYFNLRFFCSLHQNQVDVACYSYWYMTFAHELAHNLVTAHNKEHASFTEHIAAMYLPKFVQLLSQITP